MPTYGINALMQPGPAVVVAEVQKDSIAASLAASATQGSRATQQYGIMATGFAMQNDAPLVLGLLLAHLAAGTKAQQYRCSEVLQQVIHTAQFALDEIYGLRTMAEQRPDNDQMTSLLAQTAAARSSAGLPALPVLKH